MKRTNNKFLQSVRRWTTGSFQKNSTEAMLQSGDWSSQGQNFRRWFHQAKPVPHLILCPECNAIHAHPKGLPCAVIPIHILYDTIQVILPIPIMGLPMFHGNQPLLLRAGMNPQTSPIPFLTPVPIQLFTAFSRCSSENAFPFAIQSSRRPLLISECSTSLEKQWATSTKSRNSSCLPFCCQTASASSSINRVQAAAIFIFLKGLLL